MAIKLHDYDAVDFLNTEEDIQNYLNEALEDGEPAVFAKALGNVARARGMTKVAADSGVSREAIYRSFSGKGNPEFGTVVKVARAVGFELRMLSVKGKPVKSRATRDTKTTGARVLPRVPASSSGRLMKRSAGTGQLTGSAVGKAKKPSTTATTARRKTS